MNDLSMSFAGLVKSNNGAFKSPKQAAFLLSQCQMGQVFITGGHTWAGYQLDYHCDEQGVVEVYKSTLAKGRHLVWQRVTEGRMAVQDTKEHKRLTRLRNTVEKDIAHRHAARAAGQFEDAALFAWAETTALERLANIDKALALLG